MKARRLLDAAVLGLGLGLLATAAVLGVRAVRRLGSSCQGLSDAECALATELASGLARLDGLWAAGSALVGAGLVLWARARR